MDKLTPDSFGQVHMKRVERELESFPLPERMKMVEGVQGALDGLRYRIHDLLNPPEPDPDIETSEPVPGAEVTTAPGEPGTVEPPAPGEGAAP